MSEALRLDLVAARRWALSARSALADAREQINALNVFPVPDGDTGTNMFLTLDGAIEVLRGHLLARGPEVTLREGLGLLSRGTLLAARGNSGVILSQLSRGLHEAIEARIPDGSQDDIDEVDAATLAEAFQRADLLAWTGVSAPVEGTILSVSRAAAQGAAHAAEYRGARAYDVATAAVAAATSALQRTPEQLPILARAGVVDAGGAGYLILIEALQKVLSGRAADPGDSPVPDWLVAPAEREITRDMGPGSPPTAQDHSAEAHGDGAYEVMFLLTGSDVQRAARLRAHLDRIGASVQVVGGPDQWRVHVHLDHPEEALEAGVLAGHVEDVAVSDLPGSDESHTHDGHLGGTLIVGADQDESGIEPTEPMVTAVVACAPSVELARLLSAVGTAVVHSAPGSRASTGELLSAIRAVRADAVVLLPNDPDTILAAHAAAQVADQDGIRVAVVPTQTVVQALSAMAVWTSTETVEVNEKVMHGAAEATAYGSLTRAGRDAETAAGPCRVGQYLGLVGRAIDVVTDTVTGAASHVVGQLVDQDTEILTVVRGRGARSGELDTVLAEVSGQYPDLEIVPVEGDQDLSLWLFGAE